MKIRRQRTTGRRVRILPQSSQAYATNSVVNGGEKTGMQRDCDPEGTVVSAKNWVDDIRL